MKVQIIRQTAVFIILLTSAFRTDIYAADTSSCDILIINSYTENCLWSDDFIEPVYKDFRMPDAPANIYTEQMNIFSITTAGKLEQYKLELLEKYVRVEPRLIILLGNPAWVLLSETIDRRWHGVPVLLCAEKATVGPAEIYLEKRVASGNSEVALKDYAGDIPLSVFYAPYYVKETLELMAAVVPNMRKLVFLSDNRWISAQCRKEVGEVMTAKFPQVLLECLIAEEVTNDALVDSLKASDSVTAVLFLSWQKEEQQGNSILTSNISRWLSHYSNSPIFTLHNNATEDNGLIGGCFWRDSEIKEHLLPVIRSCLDESLSSAGSESGHDGYPPSRYQLCRLFECKSAAQSVSCRCDVLHEAPHVFRAKQILHCHVGCHDDSGNSLRGLAAADVGGKKQAAGPDAELQQPDRQHAHSLRP